jgi:hypothetical protein
VARTHTKALVLKLLRVFCFSYSSLINLLFQS